MMRQPAVADRFYPGSPQALSQAITDLTPGTVPEKVEATALICPHAGYIYSGELACKTIASAVIPKTVIILGPNHHGQGEPVAVSLIDWNMPQGVVPVDQAIAKSIISASPAIAADETAHRYEHSLEVQVPFLQSFQPRLQLVPIVISQISFPLCQEIARTIAEVIAQEEEKPLILASTDMSHYESRASATAKDRHALDKIIALDPRGLYQTVMDNHISMCGFIPVTIAILAANLLGAKKADLIDYTDSGEISGDTDQVVGYAGFVIS